MQKQPVETQKNPRIHKSKNPWWINIMPWFFISCIILEMMYGRFRCMDLVVLIVWLFIANILLTERTAIPILPKIFGILFVVMYTIDAYPNIVKLIQWSISLFIF